MIPRTNIIGVGVSAVSIPLAVETIEQWILRREKHYVCVSNVHLLTECQRDPGLKRIHNRAGMVTPDGMPLVWLSRLKGSPQVSRVYGPDLLQAMCAVSARKGYRNYFYGGAEGVASQLAESLCKQFPGLQVVGTDSPPFRALTEEEDRAAVERVNAAHPDILWVGLGAPKQERWMAAHQEKVNAHVMIGVGAAFDFLSGAKKQAPKWMQRSGLEWLYRLASEPRRLWKRYLINNPWFVYLVLLQLSGLKHFDLDGAVAEELHG